MFDFLKKLFVKKKDYSNFVVDEENNYAEIVKNKTPTEETIEESVYYVHTKPKPQYGEVRIMPMVLEQADSNPHSQMYDEKGNLIGAGDLQQIPAGITIPRGNGNNGNNGSRQNQQRQSQNQNQNQNQNNQVRVTKTQGGQPKEQPKKVIYPHFEMIDLVDGAHLYIDLPGVKKPNISIEYEDGVLIIVGKRESSLEQLKKELNIKKKDIIVHTNIPKETLSTFEYKYSFTKVVDESNMTAVFEDGILHVILPYFFTKDKKKIAIV